MVTQLVISYAKAALRDEMVVYTERKVLNFLGLINIKYGIANKFNGKSINYIRDCFWDYLMTGRY